MADNNKDKPSIWQKFAETGHALLDAQIAKAKGQMNEPVDEADFIYAKSITDEPSYQINSMGYKEKPHRILNTHLKQMAYKDSIIAAIIQTRQNQVSNHSKLVRSEQERGFMIQLKDEQSMLEKIKEELRAEVEEQKKKEMEERELDEGIIKSEEVISDGEAEYSDMDINGDGKTDDDEEEVGWELERRARQRLEEMIKEKRTYVEQFVLNCGVLEQRPFKTLKWNFDSCLRAWVRDTYTYDLISTEVVPNKMNQPHHFFPADSSTIKFAAPSLKKYKTFPGAQANLDFLYPEKEVEALDKKDALELDDEKLDQNLYKFVQVVRGRIERAYTGDEMKVGIRNMTTDIYNNGYGIAELELLVSLVSSHLNTEYYNKSYFTQGFSAKGILHLQAPIPRRKLETIRQQWHHMIRGSRNSFQTPIFAGMDKIEWIPLTQNHSDIEFSGWMNYLIKMMCAIYQIDPYEIGIGMKDEGKAGISGDNTEEKMSASKDKGLYPLLRFLENYINKNIIDMVDPDFCIKFTGLTEESAKDALNRQKEMAKFCLTVNEIRQEIGKPPLPGMDEVILSQEYLQWYDKYSQKGKEFMEKQQEMNIGGFDNAPRPGGGDGGEDNGMPTDEDLDALLNEPAENEEVAKSLRIEYYNLKD